MTKIKIMKLTRTNLRLLLASALLLVVAWFVPRNRDPGGQGDILLSMILTVRALAMPQSKWITCVGCVIASIALAGNAGLLPGGEFRIAIPVVVGGLCIVFMFWERLISWFGATKPAVPPKATQ
jgi:hypothetical protein